VFAQHLGQESAMPNLALGHRILTVQHTQLVVVQSYGSRPKAVLAKGALADAGIQAMVQADTAVCVSTLRGPARGFKFSCARKMQLWRAMLTPPADSDLKSAGRVRQGHRK
jgi:hypothetical protein